MERRLDFPDWVKAFCIVLVILTHSDFMNDAMLDKSGLFYLLCVNKTVPVFMFMSGFVFALGAKKRSLAEEYKIKRLWGKILKLTLPTVVAYIVYVVIHFAAGENMSLYEIIRRFIAGDFGYGSYYFAIMVQFVLIAPCMYELIRKLGGWGVAIIGCTNLAYEVIWTIGNFGQGVYRILVLRYLLVIAIGMYIAYEKIKPWVVGVMAATGLVYILLPYFTDYEYTLFTVEPWNRSGMGAAFYVAALMYVLLYFFKNVHSKTFVGQTLARVGQASYHIMYTQMMYFVIRPAFDKLIFDLTTLPLWSQYVADIVVCISAGIVFCVLDKKVFGKFYKTK